MATTNDIYKQIGASSQSLLVKNPNRHSWFITNIGSVSVYYLRGDRGNTVATSGENQGIEIKAGSFDGYDKEDAHEEVWIIGAEATTIILSVTEK